MDDLINRQAAIDAISEYGSVWMEYSRGMTKDEIAQRALNSAKATMIRIVKELPSAHSMQKEAKWKTAYLDHESMGRRPKILYCSRCNQCVAYPTDFCPACGADMRGE